MRRRIFRNLVCTGLCLGLGVASGFCADGPISVINARMGVAKAPRFKTDCWAQLSVTIRNQGEQADAEVLYTPLSLGFARSTTLFRKRIVVPARAEIEIKFPVLAQQDEKFIIELSVDGVAVDKQQFNSSSVSIGDPMVLILDDGVTGYSYFKDMKIENRKMTLTISQSRDLPEFWQILEGVNLVILGDIDPHRVQQPQIETLQSWIEAGGILVVSTDERWVRLSGSFLDDWLPVRMYGSRPIDAIESLAHRYGKPFEMNENLMMCEAFPSKGRVLASLQGLPLLAYRKMGLGAVVFSAVRLDAGPMGRWAGLSSMWEEIATLRERPIEVRRTSLETKREEMLSNITGLPVQEPRFIAMLLLGYLAVLVIVFSVFRVRRKLEWAWCSLLLIAPLGAGIYHSIGLSKRQEFKSTLNEISVVRMNGASASELPAPRWSWIESLHSLYSAAEETYRLHGDTADALIAQGPMAVESSKVAPAINVMAEDVTVAEKIRVNEGGLQSFKSFSTREFQGRVISGLTWGAAGLEGEITNDLGFSLQNTAILFNRQIIPLKDFAYGESKQVHLSDPKNASYTPLQAMSGGALDTTRRRILENLFTPVGNYNFAQDQPLLIGWAEQSVAQISDDDGRLRKKGLVLFLISLPFERGEGELLIPKGVCPVRVASALSFRNGKWVAMQGFASGSDIEIDFRIPPEVRDATVEEIKGRFEIENPGSDMAAHIEAFDWTMGTWVKLGNRNQFTLADPWRFVLRPVGRVRLKLSVSAIRTKVPVGDTPSLRAFKWRVQDVDIEIKGKLS